MVSAALYVGGMRQKELQRSAASRILLGTYAMSAEGLDVPALDTLVLATPRNDVEQSIGRILRHVEGVSSSTSSSAAAPTVLDLLDAGSLFVRTAQRRLELYMRLAYTVRDEEVLDVATAGGEDGEQEPQLTPSPPPRKRRRRGLNARAAAMVDAAAAAAGGSSDEDCSSEADSEDERFINDATPASLPALGPNGSQEAPTPLDHRGWLLRQELCEWEQRRVPAEHIKEAEEGGEAEGEEEEEEEEEMERRSDGGGSELAERRPRRRRLLPAPPPDRRTAMNALSSDEDDGAEDEEEENEEEEEEPKAEEEAEVATVPAALPSPRAPAAPAALSRSAKKGSLNLQRIQTRLGSNGNGAPAPPKQVSTSAYFAARE